jgi:hypothetical protein
VNDSNDQKPRAPEEPQPLETSAANAQEDEATVVWLVSYADDDDRELSVPQIAEALLRGEINGETIVWRQGAADWLPLAKVPALAKLLSSGGETAAAPVVAPNATLLRRAGVPPPVLDQVKPKTPSVRPPIAGRAVPMAKGSTKLGMPKLDPKKNPVQQLAPKTRAAVPDMTPTIPKAPAVPTGAGGVASKAGLFAAVGDEEEAPISIEPEFMRPPSPAPARAMQRAKALSPGTLGLKKPAPPPRPPMKSTPDPEPPPRAPMKTVPGPEMESPAQATPPRAKKAPPSPPRKAQPERQATAAEPGPTPDPGTPSLGTLAAPVRDESKPVDQTPTQPVPVSGGLLGAEELLARAIALDPTATGAPNGAAAADASVQVVAHAAATNAVEARDDESFAPAKSSETTAPAEEMPAQRATDAPISQARPSAPAKPAGKRSSLIYVAVGAVALIAVLFARGNPSSGEQRADPEKPSAPQAETAEPAAPAEPTPAAPAEPVAAAPAEPVAAAPVATETPKPEATAVAEPTSVSPPAAAATKPGTVAVAAAKPETPPPKEPKEVAPTRVAAVAPKAETKPAETKPAAPAAPAQREVAVGGEFDTAAASAALSGAAQQASGCRREGDPSGVAVVRVTFSNAGHATRAVIEGPPFAGTQTGGCIASTLRKATVPAYGGERVTVSKKVVIR